MAEPTSNADAGEMEWEVHRQDDNGNRFVVETGLSRDEAERLAALLESQAHKHLYWVKRRDDDYSSLRDAIAIPCVQFARLWKSVLR